jgi:hypothetical protein
MQIDSAAGNLILERALSIEFSLSRLVTRPCAQFTFVDFVGVFE